MVFESNLVEMIGNVFVDLVLRVVIIVGLTDAIIFYVVMKKPEIVTPFFVFEVIVVTIVPLVISLWFDLIYKRTI